MYILESFYSSRFLYDFFETPVVLVVPTHISSTTLPSILHSSLTTT